MKPTIIAVLLALSAATADILIGPAPCAWKRPVTAWVQHGIGWDTVYEDRNGLWFRTRRNKSDRILMLPNTINTFDTTGWETYWDACPSAFTGDKVLIIQKEPK